MEASASLGHAAPVERTQAWMVKRHAARIRGQTRRAARESSELLCTDMVTHRTPRVVALVLFAPNRPPSVILRRAGGQPGAGLSGQRRRRAGCGVCSGYSGRRLPAVPHFPPSPATRMYQAWPMPTVTWARVWSPTRTK